MSQDFGVSYRFREGASDETSSWPHTGGALSKPVAHSASLTLYTWSWAGKVCENIFFRTFSLASQSIEARQKVPVLGSFRLYLFAHFTCSTADGFGHIISTHQTQTPPANITGPRSSVSVVRKSYFGIDVIGREQLKKCFQTFQPYDKYNSVWKMSDKICTVQSLGWFDPHDRTHSAPQFLFKKCFFLHDVQLTDQ